VNKSSSIFKVKKTLFQKFPPSRNKKFFRDFFRVKIMIKSAKAQKENSSGSSSLQLQKIIFVGNSFSPECSVFSNHHFLKK